MEEKYSVVKCETLSVCYSGCNASKHAVKRLVIWCVVIWCVKAPTVPGNYWTLKNHKPKCTITWQVNQQKTKRENKSQMRYEFKLRHKGFKSSGSLSFEDMYLHTTLVCKIPRGTRLFHSAAQAWNVRRAQLLHCVKFISSTLFPASL